MKKRPVSVTVIALYLIIAGGLYLIMSSRIFNDPKVVEFMGRDTLPLPVQYARFCIGALVFIVCGVGLLKRRNWARFFYIIWNAVNFSFAIATSAVLTAWIPSLIVFLVLTFLLFRPIVNEYFSQTASAHDSGI